VLLEVIGVGGRRPVHKVKVDVVGLEVLERRGDALFDALVPGVVELGGDPDLLTGDTRVLDTETNLSLVAVGEGSVNVTVTSEESGLDSFANLVGLGLPGTETDSGNLSTLLVVSLSCYRRIEPTTYGVKGEGLLGPIVRHDCG
jgi:hypothetical protein